MYICDCGKEFVNKQAFCGHCGHCRIRLKNRGKSYIPRFKDKCAWSRGKTFIEFKEHSISNRKIVKRALIRNKIKEYKCEKCGISTWCNKPLVLQLHHINGIKNDNRIENLQLLCPNCHAQTDTYKKRKNERV